MINNDMINNVGEENPIVLVVHNLDFEEYCELAKTIPDYGEILEYGIGPTSYWVRVAFTDLQNAIQFVADISIGLICISPIFAIDWEGVGIRYDAYFKYNA